jgi:hypothetical protein
MTEYLDSLPPVADAAQHGLKEAHAGPDRVAESGAKTTGAWRETKFSPSPADLKAVQERAMDFAADEAESALTFAGKICNAKSLEELLTLQTQFVQHQMQTLAMNEQALYRLTGETARQAA